MTANQIPYDAIDWLQIAIYFLALPVVAFFGAAIGLLGRTRRGGILWSTNVGLLGGAVACLILAYGISTTGVYGSRSFYAYFTGQYRWMMLLVTLFATAACALTAGAAWRLLHKPREKQPLNISIGNVMLVQLFAFISMGSFIALRLFMLESSGEIPVVQQKVRIHGWELESNGKTIFLDNRSMSPTENEKALAKWILEEVAQISSLEYAAFNLDGAWNVDLTPLLKHDKLKQLTISLQQPTNAQLAPIISSKVKTLALDGDTSKLDLSRFEKANSLKVLALIGFPSKANIEALENGSLEHLSVMRAQIQGSGGPVRVWPKSIVGLSVLRSDLSPADFASLANHQNLVNLNLPDTVMQEKDLQFLPTLQGLKSAILNIDANSDTWYEPLANHNEAIHWLTIQSDDFSLADAAALTNFTQLKRLNLDLADHPNDIVDELINIDSLEHLTITSPDLTEEALLKFAVMPKLQALEFPPHLNTPIILNKFSTTRLNLKLDQTHLAPTPRTPKPAPKKANKSSKSQDAEVK